MQGLQIDPQKWAELNRLLDVALDLPSAQRATWVENLDQQYSALKPRLRELLARAAWVETCDFLGNLPHIDAAAAAAESPTQAGICIGPYRLERELGAGGMGTVWLAQRVDGLINRPAALKLPLGIWRRPGLAERIARERDILAQLEHPHIARLYDAGLTADGQPYLAIEYVEGRRIDEYCAQHALTTPQRLQLFLQVTDAVAHAHSKLVVHRDLKPANVLVTPAGQVRLLDFGIAAILEQGAVKTSDLTQMAGRALTPDYASPEQIRGEAVTTASDVYSLGVLLYELLSGQRPYRLRRESPGALEEAILHADPPRPSEVVEDQVRRRELRGDLDTIVLKALKKWPQERYVTVNALADDIARYLGNRPVLAQPDSGGYRLRKFVARHRLGVAAAALVLLAVLAGAGLAVWQARVAITERDRAEEVTRFITSVFRDADPYEQGGGQPSGTTLLRTAQARIATQFATRPELRIELLTIMGSSLKGLSDLASAETALRQAVEESTRLYGPGSLPTVRARVQLADIFNARREKEQLETELEELLPLARAIATEDLQPFAQLLVYRADLQFQTGDLDEALTAAREAFDVARRALGDHDRLTVQASNLQAEAMLNLYGRQDAPPADQMLAEARRGLEFARAAYGEQGTHPSLLYMQSVHARFLGSAGFYREAIAAQVQNIAAMRAVLGPAHSDVADALEVVCSWERRLGELRSSLAHCREALDIRTTHLRMSKRSQDYVLGLTQIGATLLQLRQPVEAEELLGQAVSTSNELVGETHWDSLTPRFYRAWALAYLGRASEAQALLEIANDPRVADSYPLWRAHVSGAVKRLVGDAAGAAAAQKRALALVGDGPKADWDRIRLSAELGLAELDLGNTDAAYAALTRARTLADAQGVSINPAYAEVLVALGQIELLRHSPERALPLLERADAFWRDFDSNNRGAGAAALWLGRGQLDMDRRAEATQNFARASQLLANSPLPGDVRLYALARVR